MATRAPREIDTDHIELSPALPSDLSAVSRLSWELGTRVVGDDATTRHSQWSHAETPRELSFHRATNNTVVIQVRTPVGRERFYGTTIGSLEAATSSLDADPQWQRTA